MKSHSEDPHESGNEALQTLRDLPRHERPLLKYIGMVGALAYVVFYLIRFTRPNPRPFDDLAMRLIVIVLFTLLAVRDRWPEHLKKYYLAYSYLVLIYCLPFFNVFNSLEREAVFLPSPTASSR